MALPIDKDICPFNDGRTCRGGIHLTPGTYGYWLGVYLRDDDCEKKIAAENAARHVGTREYYKRKSSPNLVREIKECELEESSMRGKKGHKEALSRLGIAVDKLAEALSRIDKFTPFRSSDGEPWQKTPVPVAYARCGLSYIEDGGGLSDFR